MDAAEPTAFNVTYRDPAAGAPLAEPGTLAVFEFGVGAGPSTCARHVRIPLPPVAAPAPYECWTVAAPVASGADGALYWAAGGGWRLTRIEVEEGAGGIEAASEHAYRLLLAHVAASPEARLQRIWNYLGAINAGTGDRERYRLFCNGRARAMRALGFTQYPAATAIGHQGPRGWLQVYALSATAAGNALENPRQLSAWRYPRQYGPTAPGFARAMRMPGGALAISGTAAVIGHASHHAGDVSAQTREAITNLRALLDRSGLPRFDTHAALKVYVRNPATDAGAVRATLASTLDPAVPCLLLHGDVCRRELLVEIDGWRFAP